MALMLNSLDMAWASWLHMSMAILTMAIALFGDRRHGYGHPFLSSIWPFCAKVFGIERTKFGPAMAKHEESLGT